MKQQYDYLTQTLKLGGDGGNEVTLPPHVGTDSSCSSNALCPLGESRACQRDDYIKKKLQKRKKKKKRKVQIQVWILQAYKETKGATPHNKGPHWRHNTLGSNGSGGRDGGGGSAGHSLSTPHPTPAWDRNGSEVAGMVCG